MKRKIILILSSILSVILLFNLALLIIMGASRSSFTVSEITIESLGDEREYNGEALTKDDFKITSGNLYDGDYIKASYDGFQTLVGESRNLFEVKIYNKYDMDVTNEYDINYVYGSLKINKREITVKLIDEEIEYDAKEAFLDQYEITKGSLVGNDFIEIETSEGLTTIGSKRITFTAHVFDELGNDVSNNYNITSIDGTITRTAVNLTVKSKGAEKTYDGTPLSCCDYEIKEGSLMEGDNINITYGSSISEVGTINNEFDLTITNTSEDGVITDVTSNYIITKEYGVLAVDPIELLFVSGDHAKTYDGITLSITEDDISYFGELPSFAQIGIEPTKEIINVGSISNEFNVYIFKINESGEFVLDEEGNKVELTSNFAITKQYGILTVNKVDLSIQTGSLEKSYDGLSSTITQYDCLNIDALVSGNIISATPATSKVDVGEYDNLMNISIITNEGKNVTFNYNLKITYGKLIINPIRLKIQTGSATKNYDGTPLTCDDFYLISGDLISGHYMEFINNSTITDVGNVRNYGTVAIYDSLGTKINSNNYVIEYTYGVLRVVNAKEIIYLQPENIYVKYQAGSIETYSPKTVLGFEEYIKKGYSIVAEFEGEQTEPGSSVTNITSYTIYNKDLVDVTDDFYVELYPGIVMVYLFEIHITTDSKEKIFDGTPLTCDDESNISIEVIGHDNPELLNITYKFTGSQTSAGTSKNRVVITSITETNGSNNVVIDIDKIKVDYDLGDLTVTKKEIKIETISKTFDYDENEKYYSDTTILGADYDWLVDNNYSVEIVDLTIMSGKGIAENVLTLKIYDFNHNDVTLSFIITYEYGTIKVI